MPTLIDLNIPAPRNDGLFEELCRDLWARIWNDPNVTRHGRSGQKQHGVDVVGRPNMGSRYAGIQCKAVVRPLTLKKINTEVTSALSFQPQLETLIIATTAPKDAEGEAEARKIADSHLSNGLFSVTLLGWSDILSRLENHRDLVDKYLTLPPNPAAIEQEVRRSNAAILEAISILPETLSRRILEREDTLVGPAYTIFPDQRLQVYIGTLGTGLTAETAAAIRAVTDLRLSPISVAPGRRSDTGFLAFLQQSQVFIGIVGSDYAPIRSGATVAKLEEEYDNLDGRPGLLYVKGDAEQVRDNRVDAILTTAETNDAISISFFDDAAQLSDQIKNDIQQLLSDRFLNGQAASINPVAYLDILVAEIGERTTIDRTQVVDDVHRNVVEDRHVLLYGDPGVGKTFILGAYGKQRDALYISLRNRTPHQVLENLANLFLIRRGALPQSLPSETIAGAILQQELARSIDTILIDDADQNRPAIEVLASLDYCKCSVIVASRQTDARLLPGFVTVEIKPFDETETRAYIAASLGSISDEDCTALFVASKGNPLYLYYFTQYQVHPLPKGLTAYQQALWDQRGTREQEAMSYIALSKMSLGVGDIQKLFEAAGSAMPLMDAQRVLARCFPLIRPVTGKYVFFHPYFQEFVGQELETTGLVPFIHSLLGVHAAEEGWTVAAAYHHLRCNDERMRDYLQEAISISMLRGETDLAREFALVERDAALAGDELLNAGIANYFLGDIYGKTAKWSEGKASFEDAITNFVQAGEVEWEQIARVGLATLLTTDGQFAQTIEELQSALAFFSGTPNLEAYCLVNLTFAYLKASRFHEGVETGERAAELLEEQDNREGTLSALGNLGSCYAQLEDFEKVESIARRIISEAVKYGLPRFEALGLNQLARVLRHREEHGEAEKVTRRAVDISKRIGNIEAVALNIANLGNIYLDQDRYKEADACYLDALALAREHSLRPEEAHTLELIGRLRRRQANISEAIRIGKEAYDLSTSIGEPIRIASSARHLAASLEDTGAKDLAADMWEVAAGTYNEIGDWDLASFAWGRVVSLVKELSQRDRLNVAATKGVATSILAGNTERTQAIIARTVPLLTPPQTIEFYRNALQAYVSTNPTLLLRQLIVDIMTFLKTAVDGSARDAYGEFVDILCTAIIEQPATGLFTALVWMVEQSSDDLLTEAEVDEIATRLARGLEHFYYNHRPTDAQTWTVGFDWNRPAVLQLVALGSDLPSLRVTFALALIFYAYNSGVEAAITEFGGNQEDGFALQVTGEVECVEQTGIILPKSDVPDVVASVAGSRLRWKEKRPLVIVLHAGYADRTNWTTTPENKAFLWVVMNVFKELVIQSSHVKLTKTTETKLSKLTTTFCRSSLG